MPVFVKVGLFVMLLICSYQDFKYRAISWLFLVMLSGISFIHSFLTSGLPHTAINVLQNSLFTLLQMLLVTMYYSVRRGEIVFIVNNYIGVGDILFLLAISPLFDLPLFIVFNIVTVGLALIIYGLKTESEGGKKFEVPFAGILSVCLIVILTASWLSVSFAGRTLEELTGLNHLISGLTGNSMY